jgi:hypothetical protein
LGATRKILEEATAANKALQPSTKAEDEAAMYMRQYEKRHPDPDRNASYRKLHKDLLAATIMRNLAQRLAALDASPPSIEAHAVCLVVVKDGLKAPSTADFQNSNEDYIQYLGRGKFHVQTAVDAQNSFGAKLRKTFDCKVQCYASENCEVTSLKEF